MAARRRRRGAKAPSRRRLGFFGSLLAGLLLSIRGYRFWQPQDSSSVLAFYDPTRIRPARGAGPHSRALVPMALALTGVTTTGPYLQGSVAGLTTSSDICVRFLHRPTGNAASPFSLADNLSGSGVYNAILLYGNGSNLYTRHASNNVDFATGLSFTAGVLSFVEIFVAADGSYRRLRIWDSANGLREAEDSTAAGAGWSAAPSLVNIGSTETNPGARFAGSIAEFGVWNAAPTVAGTAAFANGEPGLAIETANLVEFFPLDAERQGVGVVSGSTLTQYNSPTWSGTEVAVLRDLCPPRAGYVRTESGQQMSVSATLNNSNVYTQSVRFRLADWDEETGALFGMGGAGGTDFVRVFVSNDGYITLESWASSVNTSKVAVFDVDDRDTWHTLTLVVNGATSRTIYLDDSVLLTDTVSSNPASITVCGFGCYPVSGILTLPAVGVDFSSAVVIEEALTAAKVAALAGGTDPRLISSACSLYAPLDSRRSNAAGTTAYDLSGSGNNLTLSGSVPVLTDRGAPAAPAPAHAIGWGQGVTWAGSGNARYLVFDGGTDATLIVDGAPWTVAPGEIHAAFAPDADGGSNYFVTISNGGSFELVGLGGNSNNRTFVRYEEAGAGGDTLQHPGPGAPPDGTWRTACARMVTTTDQRLCVNGIEDKDTGTSSVTPAGLDRVIFGAQTPAGANPAIGKLGRVQFTAATVAAERLRIARYNGRPHAVPVGSEPAVA